MPNGLKTALLLGLLSGVLLALGDLLGGSNGLMVAFVFAVLMNFASYWFSDKLVLRMYSAQPVGPEHQLYRMVERLATRANLPMPKVYIIPDPSPNAFATGRNPKHGAVAVTEGLLELLDPRELRGVLAHELSHIKNRDVLVSTVAAILASAISTVANALSFGAMFGGHSDEDGPSPLATLAIIIVAPLAALLVQLAISRSREFHADETGARISGDPDALARALLKLHGAARVVPTEHPQPGTASLFIVNPFEGLQRVSRWFSTHPSMDERVERLRALSLEHRHAYGY